MLDFKSSALISGVSGEHVELRHWMLASWRSMLNSAMPAPRNVQGACQEMGKLHGNMEVQHVQRCFCQVWRQSQGAEQRGDIRNQRRNSLLSNLVRAHCGLHRLHT